MMQDDRKLTELELIASRLTGEVDGAAMHNLPSVDGVVAVVNDIRELLFPGYRKMRRPALSDQWFEYADLLRRIECRLRLEVGRALQSLDQPTIKLHLPEDDCCSHERPPVQITRAFLRKLPMLKETLQEDVSAAFDGDPAARTQDEIILSYPGVEAVMVYRIAHELHALEIPYLPRMLSEWAHRETGIDIHPGAEIGPRFFIDHGTGVVVGETCVLGTGVTLYQGVTLGAWSFPRDDQGNLIRGQKRHPTLNDNVTVYSNATILGGSTEIGAGSLIGSNVTLNRSVPPNTIVTIEKPSLRFREVG